MLPFQNVTYLKNKFGDQSSFIIEYSTTFKIIKGFRATLKFWIVSQAKSTPCSHSYVYSYFSMKLLLEIHKKKSRLSITTSNTICINLYGIVIHLIKHFTSLMDKNYYYSTNSHNAHTWSQSSFYPSAIIITDILQYTCWFIQSPANSCITTALFFHGQQLWNAFHWQFVED